MNEAREPNYKRIELKFFPILKLTPSQNSNSIRTHIRINHVHYELCHAMHNLRFRGYNEPLHNIRNKLLVLPGFERNFYSENREVNLHE